MKKVFQTVVDSKNGDCMRAVIASLFDMKIEQVPHFGLWGGDWFQTLYYFAFANGWQYVDHQHRPKRLFKKYSVNGYYYAGVPSLTFEGHSHAVIVNLKGRVVHDPNPNKTWLNKNPLKTGKISHVYRFVRRKSPNSFGKNAD